MALIVEDGAGRSDAESLASVSFCDAYHTARGNVAWTALEVEAKEQALRRATTFLDNAYAYKGLKVHGRDQALSWPRAWVEDRDGYAVESDSIPREIQCACAEVALAEAATPGVMAPTYEANRKVKSEQVDVLRVEYATESDTAEGARPCLLIVEDLIGGLLDTKSGSALSAEAVRV